MSEHISKPGLLIDNDLWVLLQRARSVATRARNLELSPLGLNIEQISVIHTLMIRGGSASIEEISQNVIRRKNSVTIMVNRMSKKGLVRKERLKAGNKLRILLTSKAQNLVKTVPNISLIMLFSDFSAQEKAVMVIFLKQVISKGLDMLGENYTPPFLSSNPNEKPDRRTGRVKLNENAGDPGVGIIMFTLSAA